MPDIAIEQPIRLTNSIMQKRAYVRARTVMDNAKEPGDVPIWAAELVMSVEEAKLKQIRAKQIAEQASNDENWVRFADE